MPRGFSRGGGGGGSGRGNSSSGRGRSSQPSRASQPKGQVRDGKSVQYSIKGSDGQTKYIGTTNNPTRRAAQHQETGKMGPGDRMNVETRPTSRSKAESVEGGKLRTHRQTHGRNPQHNKTNDGKYHPR